MRIALVDYIAWDYTIDTAYCAPLGGSQSALCYLAEELAKGGHEVFLLNRCRRGCNSRGVRVMPLDVANAELLRSLDVVIVQNRAAGGVELRPLLRGDARLILWTQHAHDQPAVQSLCRPEIRQAYDAFVLVSLWQQEQYRLRFDLDPLRCRLMRNAVAPAFAGLFTPGQCVLKEKTSPPVSAYTSTPYRGLDILVAVFPMIRAAVPGATLRVYSSMQVYQHSAEQDETKFGELYRRCQQTEGIEYVGSVPQPELARQLQSVSLLAYPNHFPETSCIAVSEAMAAGCRVVTSRLGALPETTAGFARLVPVTDNWNDYARAFVAEVVDVLRPDADQAVVEDRLAEQVAYVNRHYAWPARAAEWTGWLAELTCGAGTRAAARIS